MDTEEACDTLSPTASEQSMTTDSSTSSLITSSCSNVTGQQKKVVKLQVPMTSGNVYKLASSIPVAKQLHRQLLLCGLCLKRYNSPKLLPCLHTFCVQCLRDYVPAESLSATCPICRQQSILPRDEGVSGLQNNVFIVNLMDVIDKQNACSRCEKVKALSKCTDCDVFVCDGCLAAHGRALPTTTHHVISYVIDVPRDLAQHQTPSTAAGLLCGSHDGHTLEFYCSDCETAVCEMCKFWQHLSHPTQTLYDSLDSQRQMLTQLLDGASEQIETLKSCLANIHQINDDLMNNYRDVSEKICKTFEALITVLCERRDMLVNDVTVSHAQSQQQLTEQADSLETLLVDINNCCELTKNALKHGNETEVLIVRKEMTEKLSRLKEKALPAPPSRENLMQFSFDDTDFSSICHYLQGLGGVRTCCHGDEIVSKPLNIVASGNGLTNCFVGTPTVVSILSRDIDGNAVSVTPTSFLCRITLQQNDKSESSDDIVCFPSVCRSRSACVDDGNYELTYTVQQCGTYKLTVRYNGRHINGSPFTLTASTKQTNAAVLATSSSSSSTSSSFKSSRQRSASRTPSGPISNSASFSSNSRNSSAQAPVASGTKRPASSPLTNHRSASLHRPRTTVTGTGTGTAAANPVAAGNNVSRQRTTATSPSRCLTTNCMTLTTTTRRRLPQHSPCCGNRTSCSPVRAVTVRQSAEVSPVQPVVVRNENCELVLRVGSHGRNMGEFVNPQGVCCTNDGRVLIADSNTACVQVFDIVTGQFLLRFGTKGHLPGQLMRPTGLAVTSSGNFLVADYDNCCVSVFSCDGQYLHRLGTNKLIGPKGICTSESGQHANLITVVDNKGCTINIYDVSGKLVNKFGSRGSDQASLSGPNFCTFTPRSTTTATATAAATTTPLGVVVTDFHNHSVKVFDVNDGRLRFSFGSFGQGNGQFNGPTGVAVDAAGNIVIADWGNARIQIFDSQGSFVALVDTTVDPLYGPQGLTLSPRDDYVIVADSGNHCFKVFKYSISS